MAQKIKLALLWHQHQPFYQDLKTGASSLPWVRLHATKDYYDMAAILDDFPDVRVTINLVPSLLAQMEAFADGRGTDPWLEKTLLPADQLKNDDKVWILENFFFCNWDNMIFPNARYAELFEKRGRFAQREKIERSLVFFTQQDFLDLQCWFNLAWMDPIWKKRDPTVGHLYMKGRGFSEGEKLMLVEKQREICRLTVEKHKQLWDEGRIEISTTPFYHPILPLLCDTDSAQMSMPGSLKPRKRYRHPEDARRQIEAGLKYMEKVFGRRPVGMWPSEGSVSEEAAALMAEAGLEWAASDEEIFFRSRHLELKHVSREDLFHPYKVGDGKLQMVFRDHALSDSIGFIYARMDAQSAVDDFVHRLCKIADSLPEAPAPALVSVILDGENCWESYANDGHDFLEKLYRALSDHPRISTTTIGDYARKHPARETLSKLWAGSWINKDFSIWIGHPEDNRAWDLVSEARDFLAEYEKQHPEKRGDPALASAWESLYIAQGSDWCWWYGDQNSTAQDDVFDELFRAHVKNVYTFLGVEPPQNLNIAIKGHEKRGQELAPLALITPKVDGLVTNYYEWRLGGFYQTALAGGTMHQAENFLASFHYGFDLEKLYFRFDSQALLRDVRLSEIKLKVLFMEPAETEFQIDWDAQEDAETKRIVYQPKGLFLNAERQTFSLQELGSKKIIEVAIPFSLLKAKPDDPIEFAVVAIRNGLQLERWPYHSSIMIRRPNADFGQEFWSV